MRTGKGCLHGCVLSHSGIPDSLRPHRLQPARLLCPGDSPGRNTGVGSQSQPRAGARVSRVAGRLTNHRKHQRRGQGPKTSPLLDVPVVPLALEPHVSCPEGMSVWAWASGLRTPVWVCDLTTTPCTWVEGPTRLSLSAETPSPVIRRRGAVTSPSPASKHILPSETVVLPAQAWLLRGHAEMARLAGFLSRGISHWLRIESRLKVRLANGSWVF